MLSARWLLPVVLVTSASATSAPSLKLQLMPLDPADRVADSGGCTISLGPKDNHVFSSTEGLLGASVLKVDGERFTLKVVRSKDTANASQPAVGDQSFVEYRAGKLEVRIDYRVSATCSPNAGDCGEPAHLATITLRKDGATRTYRSLPAGCGC